MHYIIKYIHLEKTLISPNQYRFMKKKRATVTNLSKFSQSKLFNATFGVPHSSNLAPRITSRAHYFFYCEMSRTNILLKSPLNIMYLNFNKIAHVCDHNFNTFAEIIHEKTEYFIMLANYVCNMFFLSSK